MNLLLAAMSGWGKSFKGQEVIEKNIPKYDHVVVLDYCDEFRGLCKADLAKWWIAGPREENWSVDQWREFIEANEKVVLARHQRLTAERWKELAAVVVAAARRTGDVLIVIDEAHFVAPQSGAVPDPITGLATTGRGEGASSIWITQRLAKAEEDVVSQCQARLLGGFESDADLGKVAGVVEYPSDLHNPQNRQVARTPDELLPPDRDEPVSLQKHTEDPADADDPDDPDTIGSEWIYSDNDGNRDRRNTEGLAASMESTHYGAQGKSIKV